MSKKILFLSSILASLSISNAIAKESEQYPNLSGKALFELRSDRVTSTNKPDVDSNNADLNIDANFDLSFTKNWSLLSNWRVRPVSKRDTTNNPERYREVLGAKRGFGLNDDGLIIEELKGQFENDDARFFFGKFNPAFGTAFRKEKRMGVFVTDFTKDYEIREKIGGGFTALLENSELTLDVFMNDTTPLSNTAIERRGKENRSNGLAGNTSGPSSYTASVEGQNLFGVHDLFYNLGYRNLAVDKMPGRDDENGFVGGLEYLFPVGAQTSVIPFIEVAKIDNLSGIEGRDALYSTIAVIAKYSGWSTSAANVTRNIKTPAGTYHDRLIQYSVGYKFGNNVAIDLSKANIKEDGYKASMIGLLVSYVYNF